MRYGHCYQPAPLSQGLHARVRGAGCKLQVLKHTRWAPISSACKRQLLQYSGFPYGKYNPYFSSAYVFFNSKTLLRVVARDCEIRGYLFGSCSGKGGCLFGSARRNPEQSSNKLRTKLLVLSRPRIAIQVYCLLLIGLYTAICYSFLNYTSVVFILLS